MAQLWKASVGSDELANSRAIRLLPIRYIDGISVRTEILELVLAVCSRFNRSLCCTAKNITI